MARYRKKPVVIDAVRVEWQSPMPEEPPLLWVLRWAESFGADTSDWVLAPDRIEVPTLEGVMTAQRGDYLIRGVEGEFYPCKPEIFHQTYEEVEAQ